MGIWRNIGKIVILVFQIVHEQVKWYIGSWKQDTTKKSNQLKKLNPLNEISKIKKEALNTMILFEDFNPHLTGQLLEGLIPKFPKIQINLFTDNIKEVEYTLLNNNIAFDVRDTIYQEKLSKKKSTKTIPAFILEGAWFPIELKVYFENDIRSKKYNLLSNKGKNIKAIKEFEFDSTTSSTLQLAVRNM